MQLLLYKTSLYKTKESFKYCEMSIMVVLSTTLSLFTLTKGKNWSCRDNFLFWVPSYVYRFEEHQWNRDLRDRLFTGQNV